MLNKSANQLDFTKLLPDVVAIADGGRPTAAADAVFICQQRQSKTRLE
jgi:hypothetical protein